jgi:alginate O-acetyltransferase complex protein AlgI
MVFSSLTFVFLFLPLTLGIYFILPLRWRNVFLLAASLLFYAWGEVNYTLVMLASIIGNYLFGCWIEDATGQGRRRWLITLAVILNLGLLGFFKYANFVMENVDLVLAAVGLPTVDLARVHLPLGISFFTFQAMSYVIDVYRRRVAAQRRLRDLALYITLFPQLIAGPIVRYIDVARELVERRVSRGDFAAGVRIFLVGLGKKVLIANTLATQADQIFAIPGDQLPTSVAWIGIVFFTLQLYFDFGGYSDMAIGLGRMLGFHFLPNFNYPYISRTLTECWQRWHISLSTWFRDYLFRPLGGYRVSRPRAYVNLMIVFFLCGLWHGPSWNFVMFGVYQGVILIVERLARATHIKALRTPLGNAYFILVLLTIMVFFRTDSLAHAGAFFKAMFGFVPPNVGVYRPMAYLPPEAVVAAVAAIIGSTPFMPWLSRVLSPRGDERRLGLELVRQTACFVGLAAVLLLSGARLAAGTHNPFIYFRF